MFAAGVPETAKPMSTLDNADAMVFLFTLWFGKF